MFNSMICFSVLSIVKCEMQSIKQLYLSSNNKDFQIIVNCPTTDNFYQWKKYYNGKSINLLNEDNKKINVTLKHKESPVTYECKATGGFVTKIINTTLYLLDSTSKSAKEQCYRTFQSMLTYPCFFNATPPPFIIHPQSTPVNIHLDCEASAHPPSASLQQLETTNNITYSWYRLPSSRQLDQMTSQDVDISHLLPTKLRIENLSNITLDSSAPNIEGQYLCLANLSTNPSIAIQRIFTIIYKSGAPSDTNKASRKIEIKGPSTENVTLVENQSANLICDGQVLDGDSLSLIQWGKRLYSGLKRVNEQQEPRSIMSSSSEDKNSNNRESSVAQVLQFEGDSYQIITSKSRTSEQRFPPSRAIARLHIAKASLTDTPGHYLCVAISRSGSIDHKAYNVNVLPSNGASGTSNQSQMSSNINGSHDNNTRSSLFFLYILIPSLIIAVSLFAGIYLSLHRRPSNRHNNHHHHPHKYYPPSSNHNSSNVVNTGRHGVAPNNNNINGGGSDVTITNKTELDSMLLRHTPPAPDSYSIGNSCHGNGSNGGGLGGNGQYLHSYGHSPQVPMLQHNTNYYNGGHSVVNNNIPDKLIV